MTQIEDNNLIVFPEPTRHFFVAIRDNPGGEMIVIGLTKTTHITIHFGMKSKILDVHYTDETFSKGDARRHKTILQIPHEKLDPLAEHLENTLTPVLVSCFMGCKINLGKLGRHNCILGQMTGDDLEQNKFVKLKKGKMKFPRSFDKEFLRALFLYPQELPSKPASHYLVYKIRNGRLVRQGFIWFPKDKPTRKPFYVKFKHFNMMTRVIQKELMTKHLELGIYYNKEVWQEIRSNYNALNS